MVKLLHCKHTRIQYNVLQLDDGRVPQEYEKLSNEIIGIEYVSVHYNTFRCGSIISNLVQDNEVRFFKGAD
jgi:hypothetical protein